MNFDTYFEETPKKDQTWEVFGISDKRDYLDQFFIPKNCHSNVPEGIVKELEHAEYLQSHSYYYYPMYGDAFSRLTRIFEMAVKEKARLLNQNIRNKSLHNIIKDISSDYPEDYCINLNWGRKMRNMNAHPEMSIMYGSILKLPLIRITNIINDVFREASYFDDAKKKLKLIETQFSKFQNGLYIYKGILIESIIPLGAFNGIFSTGFKPVTF